MKVEFCSKYNTPLVMDIKLEPSKCSFKDILVLNKYMYVGCNFSLALHFYKVDVTILRVLYANMSRIF